MYSVARLESSNFLYSNELRISYSVNVPYDDNSGEKTENFSPEMSFCFEK